MNMGNSITESIFDKDGQLAWGREGGKMCCKVQ